MRQSRRWRATYARELGVTPHVAQNESGRRSAIDSRTATQPGYAVSQRIRKRVEEIFGWLKTVAGGRKLRHIGVRRNQLWAEFAVTAFNLVRMGNLVVEAARERDCPRILGYGPGRPLSTPGRRRRMMGRR